MVTTHEEHQCKECKEKCSTFMELLKHISKQHYLDKEGIQCEDDDIGKGWPDDEKEENKDSSYEETRLDKVNVKKN